jgi:CRP/FNR family cyclic AMP-dependent transcriptional regulator
MYLKQADLFWGMSQSFIQSVTAKAVKQEFQPDEVIFKADDPAEYFYVLIKGKVRLELKSSGQRVYTAQKVGEIFGWSALIGRKEYSATVICEQPCIALKFHNADIGRVLDRDVENAAQFYKQLAGALGDRLLQSYDLIE